MAKFDSHSLCNIFPQSFQAQAVSQTGQFEQVDRVRNLICPTVDVVEGELDNGI